MQQIICLQPVEPLLEPRSISLKGEEFQPEAFRIDLAIRILLPQVNVEALQPG